MKREIKQKLATGMNILLRIGSAPPNMDGVLRRIAKGKAAHRGNMMFCTDDKHIEDIRRRRAHKRQRTHGGRRGIDPIEAIKMVTPITPPEPTALCAALAR